MKYRQGKVGRIFVARAEHGDNLNFANKNARCYHRKNGSHTLPYFILRRNRPCCRLCST
ncbi:MAG: hypothetical protein ACOY40_11770 [Bacillota bacterium]